MLAEAARDPDRFRAIATVPLQEPELAAAELRYATSNKTVFAAIRLMDRAGYR